METKKYNLFREKVLYELPIDIKELEKRKYQKKIED
ncbi:hypothetical protein FUSNEC_GEN_129_03410 [Fusobacterium necrophorum subsp. funduliforme]